MGRGVEEVPPPPVTPEAARRVVGEVLAAIEVVDSHLRDWKMTGPEAIADCTCMGAVVVRAAGAAPRSVDLPAERVTVLVNGNPVATAQGLAALGDPVRVLVWLANRIADLGRRLRAGDLILTGSLAPIQWVREGDTAAVSFDHLGSASVRFL